MIACSQCGKPITPGPDHYMQGRAQVKGKTTNVYLHDPECVRKFFRLQEVPQ